MLNQKMAAERFNPPPEEDFQCKLTYGWPFPWLINSRRLLTSEARAEKELIAEIPVDEGQNNGLLECRPSKLSAIATL